MNQNDSVAIGLYFFVAISSQRGRDAQLKIGNSGGITKPNLKLGIPTGSQKNPIFVPTKG
jgi:hypothetical protein